MTNGKNKNMIHDLVSISLFASLITICSWITVPFVIPFTLQTFAIFLTVALLGGKRGTIAVCCYILLGICGLPVFSNFNSGASTLLGTTGGYISGFIFMALVMWAFEAMFGKKTHVLVISMIVGLLVLYAFGSLWYMLVYMKDTGTVGITAVLIKCVAPYILPDIAKMFLAVIIKKRLEKHIR